MPDQTSPVLLVALLPSKDGEDVLAVQENGNLTVLSENTQTVLFGEILRGPSQQAINILAIHHLTVPEAQRSVLKQRSDLLSDATPETSYLVVTYTRPDQRENKKKLFYGVWSITATGRNTLSSGFSLQRVLEHELVLNGKDGITSSLKEKFCSFGPTASTLHLRLGATFTTYDLTGVVPSLISVLNTGFNGTPEIMALSSAFAISSFGDLFRLYDLKYLSMQAQIDTKRTGLKRKRVRMAAEHQVGPVEFVSYFPQSMLVIGRRRNQLLSIAISGASSRQTVEKGSNLVHNIGRGQSNHDAATAPLNNLLELNIGKTTVGTASGPEWHTVRKQLDQFAQAGDVSGFENAFTQDIRECAMSFSVSYKMVDDLPSSRSSIPDSKISYLLSKIFQLESNSHGSNSDPSAFTRGLKIQIPSFKLLLWLSRLRLLSCQNVQQAISASSNGLGDAIGKNAIAQALIDTDPSRELLIECMENGFSPNTEEQAAVVQLLIQQALAMSAEDATSDTEHKLDESALDTSFKAREMQVQKLSTSTSESSWLPPLLHRALVVALNIFGSCAGSTISSHLRGLFSQTEILALVQLLRQQLFQGGHTRSLQSLSTSEPSDSEGSQIVKLDVIVKVLSSCIDAIGPLGFVDTWENEDFFGNIVHDLATEITHTMQSLDDAAELHGILRETLRYQESIRKHQDAGVDVSRQHRGRLANQQSGTIVTLYSESADGDEGLQTGSGLPLSLNAERLVSPTKVRKGGGQISKRTARQKTMLERRHWGPYSFERLVL